MVERGYRHLEAGFVIKEGYEHVGSIGWMREVIDMLRQDWLNEIDYLETGFVNKEDYEHVGRIGWIRKVIDMFWQD